MMENYASLTCFHPEVTSTTYISHISLTKARNMDMPNFRGAKTFKPIRQLEVRKSERLVSNTSDTFKHYMDGHCVDIALHFAYIRYIIDQTAFKFHYSDMIWWNQKNDPTI